MTHAAALSADATAHTDSGLKVRLYAMMFLQYFVQGSYLPVVSVYLTGALGFTAAQLGTFLMAISLGPLFAPFIVGQIVDRHVATQKVLAFCHLAGGVLMLALFLQTSFWPVVALGAAYSTLYVPTMMLTNSLAFQHLRDRDREFPLVRLWGTIGFVVPAWLVEMWFLRGLSGTDLNHARGVVLALAGIAGLAMGVYSLFALPDTPPHRDRPHDLAPGRVIGMLRARAFLVLVLVSFAIGIAHNFFFVWNSPYLRAMLDQGGVRAAWEGRVSSLGQIFEVVVMAGLGFSVRRFGFKATMLVGAAAYVARCLLFASAAVQNGPWVPAGTETVALADLLRNATFLSVATQVVVGEALHGFCFGCFLAVAFMYVDRIAPKDVRGSMQNLYGNFVVSLGMLAGGFFGGWIGQICTTLPDAVPFRERFGVTSRAGLLEFVEKTADASQTLIRDWPAIWLGGAAIAAVALVAFALFFPGGVPDEAVEPPPAS